MTNQLDAEILHDRDAAFCSDYVSPQEQRAYNAAECPDGYCIPCWQAAHDQGDDNPFLYVERWPGLGLCADCLDVMRDNAAALPGVERELKQAKAGITLLTKGMAGAFAQRDALRAELDAANWLLADAALALTQQEATDGEPTYADPLTALWIQTVRERSGLDIELPILLNNKQVLVSELWIDADTGQLCITSISAFDLERLRVKAELETTRAEHARLTRALAGEPEAGDE